jgi:alpha-galactosidase
VGSEDHEVIDANTFADWQIDYLKEDSCSASTDEDTAFEQYGKMRDALNKTGRPIVFSLCGWNPWYAPKGKVRCQKGRRKDGVDCTGGVCLLRYL